MRQWKISNPSGASQEGFSLIEVLVGLGITSVVLMGPLSMIGFNNKTISDTRNQSQALSMVNELRSYFSDNNTCVNNFGGLPLSSSKVSAKSGIIVDASSNTVFTLGTKRTNESAILSDVSMTGFSALDPTFPTNQGTTLLEVAVIYPDGRKSVMSVLMSVTVDVTNHVTKCDTGPWQKGIWYMDTDGVLTYNKNVGIGVPSTSSEALTIDGGFYADYGGWSGSHNGTQIIPSASDVEFYDENGSGYFAFESAGHHMYVYPDQSFKNTDPGGQVTNSSAYMLGDKMLKLETADPTEVWSVQLYRSAGKVGDQNFNGIRFGPTNAANQGMGIMSRLVIGDVDNGNDFYSDGKAGGTNGWTKTSDIRLKKDIHDLPATVLDKLENVQGVSFDWKESGRSSIGFVAQDLAKTFSPLVDTSGKYQMVRYGEMIPVLVRSLQEVSKKAKKIEADRSWIMERLCSKYPEEAGCE